MIWRRLAALTTLQQPGECKRIVEEAVRKLGKLDTLVNCAGVLKGGAFGSPQCDLENFEFNFNVNTKSVFEMMQVCECACFVHVCMCVAGS